MSLYGMMRTGVSGMNAQSSKLSAVSDNIANSDTTGYKEADTQFSTLVLPDTGSSYASGSVNAKTRYKIADQGDLQATTSNTDLAIKGDGFFVVQDANGQQLLTRAGSFVPDGSGNLVNASGFTLLGYDYSSGAPSVTANGYAGLVPVNVDQSNISATASTSGVFTSNLPSGATAVAAADLPSANGATADYSAKTSLVAYDNLGNQKLIDLYFTKTADNQWEVAAFDKNGAGAGAAFPYAAGALLGTAQLDFDPANGKLSGTSPDSSLSLTVPGGQPMTIDLAQMTQLAADFDPTTAKVNGNGPSKMTGVTIGTDGVVSAQYDDGTVTPIYQIALADVPSPDNLEPLPGNVYLPTLKSGDVQIGFAGSGSLGSINSGALESSNVDLGTQLTEMISAQRSYTANSKVFQTGSDLLNILVNLQR